MKLALVFAFTLLMCSTSYGQLTGCFKKKSRYYASLLTLGDENTYLHKITLTGDLTITSVEKGRYTLKGDSIIFDVTDYGMDENDLKPQPGNLTRNGLVRNNAIILLAKSGDRHEKMRKTRCRQRLFSKAVF